MGIHRQGNGEYSIPGLKTRRTYYDDYGVSAEWVKKIKHYCRTARDHSLIWQAAREANPYLDEELVKSVVEGKSFDEISKKGYVAIERESFYGYQRKLIYILYVYFEKRGCKWEDLDPEDITDKMNV